MSCQEAEGSVLVPVSLLIPSESTDAYLESPELVDHSPLLLINLLLCVIVMRLVIFFVPEPRELKIKRNELSFVDALKNEILMLREVLLSYFHSLQRISIYNYKCMIKNSMRLII